MCETMQLSVEKLLEQLLPKALTYGHVSLLSVFVNGNNLDSLELHSIGAVCSTLDELQVTQESIG